LRWNIKKVIKAAMKNQTKTVLIKGRSTRRVTLLGGLKFIKRRCREEENISSFVALF
jgi:hypothetical protein